MGGWPAWLLHTLPIYWEFCAARTPCQEVQSLNPIKPSQHLRAQAGCSKYESETGGDLKGWEVEVVSYHPWHPRAGRGSFLLPLLQSSSPAYLVWPWACLLLGAVLLLSRPSPHEQRQPHRQLQESRQRPHPGPPCLHLWTWAQESVFYRFSSNAYKS